VSSKAMTIRSVAENGFVPSSEMGLFRSRPSDRLPRSSVHSAKNHEPTKVCVSGLGGPGFPRPHPSRPRGWRKWLRSRLANGFVPPSRVGSFRSASRFESGAWACLPPRVGPDPLGSGPDSSRIHSWRSSSPKHTRSRRPRGYFLLRRGGRRPWSAGARFRFHD
jgi:hypothetical protein